MVGLEDGEAGIDVVIGGGGVEEHGVERRIAEVAHVEVGGWRHADGQIDRDPLSLQSSAWFASQVAWITRAQHRKGFLVLFREDKATNFSRHKRNFLVKLWGKGLLIFIRIFVRVDISSFYQDSNLLLERCTWTKGMKWIQVLTNNTEVALHGVAWIPLP